MSSNKKTGAKAILYSATKGTLITTGALTADKPYKISKFGTASALPDLKETSIFFTPRNAGDAITLASGDSVYPLTLTEVCKVDLEFSAEQGVIDVTDSCDGPYMSNLPDGFSNLSGTINTMMRFDETTEELIDVSSDFFNRFFDIVEDDGEGTYTLIPQTDENLILMILLNSSASGVEGKVENWIITPAILSSLSANVPLKDALKGDYGWSKGDGQASYYKRTVAAISA